MLKYHQKTFNLLRKKPVISSEAVNLVNQYENKFGIKLPAAVREWYSLDGAVDILEKICSIIPISINISEQKFSNWYDSGPYDFISNGLLLIAREVQGVANWAIKLDGTDDPPVLIEVDTAPNMIWNTYIEHFSDFIYVTVWDSFYDLSPRELTLSAQDKKISNRDLDFLKHNFNQECCTHYWPGQNNYRFFKEDKCILIWDGKDEADWFIWAKSKDSLRELVKIILDCGTLRETLGKYESWSKEILTWR